MLLASLLLSHSAPDWQHEETRWSCHMETQGSAAEGSYELRYEWRGDQNRIVEIEAKKIGDFTFKDTIAILRIGEGEEALQIETLEADVHPAGQNLLRYLLDPGQDLPDSDDPQPIFLKTLFSVDIDDQLAPTAAAFRQMEDCQRRLLQKWKYDPATIMSLASPPLPVEDISRWYSVEDFAKHYFPLFDDGLIVLRIDVAADGSAKNCKVIDIGRQRAAATVACNLLLKRSMFEPALDGAGNPVAAPYIFTFRWTAK